MSCLSDGESANLTATTHQVSRSQCAGESCLYAHMIFLPDIETHVVDNDQTLFSRLARTYENAVVDLLAQDKVEGISSGALRTFRESYASTAFRCGFPHCIRLSLDFATAKLRLEHEAIHARRVYCQTASCQYSRIGFAKRGALNAHTRKHHGQPETLLVPARLRRTTDAKGQARVEALDTQSSEAQSEQPTPSSHPFLPAALIAQYPALANIRWDELPQRPHEAQRRSNNILALRAVLEFKATLTR